MAICLDFKNRAWSCFAISLGVITWFSSSRKDETWPEYWGTSAAPYISLSHETLLFSISLVRGIELY